MSTEARWLIRDGERGGGGGQSEWLVRAPDPQKTEEAVDHLQNNSYAKAAGTRRCETASVLL